MRTTAGYTQFLILTSILAITVTAVSQEPVPAQNNLNDVEVHAFVSQGYMATSANNYLTKSKEGSLEFAEMGLNFTKQLSDKLRMGVQLFARDLGALGNYDAKVDWFYMDYKHADVFGLRVGRIKIPFGLYNDVSDIDAARNSVLLPQSIYSITSRDFLLAQTGTEFYGYVDMGGAGHLDYRVFGGTVFIDLSESSTATISVDEVHTPYVYGSRVIWETPAEGLRVGGSFQNLRLDFKLTSGAVPLTYRIPANMWVGFVEYSRDAWLFVTEYGRWHVSADSSNTAILPSSSTVTSERGYVGATYRVSSVFQPGAYYSILHPNIDNKEPKERRWQDFAATLRTDLNPNWILKLEAHLNRGTAGLNKTLNNGIPLTDLEENWTSLFVKTTVYF